MTMNLRECFNRYGLKESFVRKTSSVSKRGMIEDKGNGFQIDDKEDFDQLLMDYVEKRSDVFVEGPFISNIFGNNIWMSEIVANQKTKEIDTDKIYYNKCNQYFCFYKFFIYEDELMAFKFRLSINSRKHEGYAFSSSFVCRTMEDYAIGIEDVYYIPELKEWENENVFYFYPEYSEYSIRLLKVVIKTLDLFADRFEERCMPKFPKNFHTIFWEDECNINLDKFENLKPMSSAMRKIFKENNIF